MLGCWTGLQEIWRELRGCCRLHVENVRCCSSWVPHTLLGLRNKKSQRWLEYWESGRRRCLAGMEEPAQTKLSYCSGLKAKYFYRMYSGFACLGSSSPQTSSAWISFCSFSPPSAVTALWWLPCQPRSMWLPILLFLPRFETQYSLPEKGQVLGFPTRFLVFADPGG